MENNTTTGGNNDVAMEPIGIAMLLLSCVIALVSNIFVLYLVLNVPRLKTVTNVFVFSICLCNIMFAVILLPAHCFFPNSLAYQYLVIITILVYICNLTAVSYDRLVSITNPMLYSIKLTKQKAIKIVIAMWVLPLCYCLLPLIWIREPSSTTQLVHKIYTIVTLGFLLGPLVFIVFVYIKVCLEMKKMHDFKKRSLTPTSTLNQNGNYYKQKKISRLEKLKKLPNVLLNNMRREACSQGDARMRGLKGIPSKLFYNIRTRRSLSLNSTTTNLSDSRKHSHLPDVILTELGSKLEAEQLSLKNCGVEPTYQTVTFISMAETPSSDDVCTELVKASLGNSDGRCRDSTLSIADDDSDIDTFSINSKLSYSAQLRLQPLSPNMERKRQSSISKMKRKAYELKASLAFLIVALTYMFTWLPVIVLTFNEVLGRPVELPRGFIVMSLYAIALNALSDPFLYGLLLPNFRKTLKILLRRLTIRIN